MVIDTSSDRPLTHLTVQAITGRRPSRPARRGPYAPPACDVGRSDRIGPDPDIAWQCTELLRWLLIGSEDREATEDGMVPDVVIWSPAAVALSRQSAIDTFRVDETDSGPLTEVELVVLAIDVVAPRAYAEWRLTGRFTQPCFVADDLLVEPTGQMVETSGVLVVTFDDHRIVAAHLFYDELALLEQLISTP
jgi:SnoaL-like polyketide cyclase